MNSEELGDALSWLNGTGLIDSRDEALAAATEAALADRQGAGAEAVDALGGPARRRVLRAPEVTRRLLFPASAGGDTDGFLGQAAAVERALDGTGPPPANTSWSALGDAFVGPDGMRGGWPQLGGEQSVPLDFGSTWAQHVDLTGCQEFATSERPSFTLDEVISVHRRVATALGHVRELSPTISAFVSRATCVLVLQVDGDAPHQVASGTNGHYIGRSFVTNPHRPEATLECLAEAVVHEAIHGLLYRDSRLEPWVTGAAAREVPRVASPWTGRALPVRAFLEACCVWYGLSHLWALAWQEGPFDPDAARTQLLRSVRGFAAGSLVDRVRPWWEELRPDIPEVIDHLQGRMVEALVGAP